MEQPRKKDNRTLIGVIVVAVLLGIPMLILLLINPTGGGSGDYSFYAGPVLPMTSLSGGENLEAERTVDFDFSPFAEEKESPIDPDLVIITDSYTLTNPTDEAVTVELAYGFEGQLINEDYLIPEITVDGAVIDPDFYAAVDAAERIHHSDSWETYRDAILEEDYLTEALAEAPLLDETVTVCKFSDIRYGGDEPDPFLLVTAAAEESAWAYNWIVRGTDEETGAIQMLFAPGRDGYLIIPGTEVPELSFGGNRGYNITENSALEGVSYELETYETTFGEILWELAQGYDYWADNSGYPNPGLASPELIFSNAAKEIAGLENRNLVNTYYDFDYYFHMSVVDIRMLYFIFPVEISAGETVTVTARYHQEGSRDNGGPRENRIGYDLATRLGSNLNFTAQSASLTNSDWIRILRQNFGFDLEQGVTQVTLDPETERYYLDVAKK